jgi:hypothetical protein
MVSSMMVTIEAMISIKTGKRISWRSKFLMSDTSVPDNISVIVVAIPRPSPLIAVDVTANSGHKPNNWTNAELLVQSPFSVIFFKFSICISFSRYQK